MTTTTVTPAASTIITGAVVTPFREVSLDDLGLAAARTESLIESGASPAEVQAAATHEMHLADMFVIGHGEADLDEAARAHLAALEASRSAQAQYDASAAANPDAAAQHEAEVAAEAEHEPEAGG
jgi:hypothetical protein